MRIKDFEKPKDRPTRQYLNPKTIRLEKMKEIPVELNSFISKLQSLLPLRDILVSGVDGRPPRKTSQDRYRQRYGRGEPKEESKPWLSYGETTISRKYTIGLVVERKLFGLEDFLTNQYLNYSGACDSFYEHVIKPAAKHVETQFFAMAPKGNHIENLRIGLLNEVLYRIWFDVIITTSFVEFIKDVGRFHLTAIGIQFTDPIAKHFRQLLHEQTDLDLFIIDRQVKKAVLRELENRIRKEHGFHKIGEGYVSETLLAKLIEESFPSAEREKTFAWLGLQRLDIFIPELKIALEYHGEQHYEPIVPFGGKPRLEKQMKMDLLKKQLCQRNGITLVEWPYWVKIERQKVVTLLTEVLMPMSNTMGNTVTVSDIKITYPL